MYSPWVAVTVCSKTHKLILLPWQWHHRHSTQTCSLTEHPHTLNPAGKMPCVLASGTELTTNEWMQCNTTRLIPAAVHIAKQLTLLNTIPTGKAGSLVLQNHVTLKNVMQPCTGGTTLTSST